MHTDTDQSKKDDQRITMAEILKEGMLAEVIVLDRNLFEVKPKEILDTKVLVTIMDGEIIY